jgi:fumarylacetoacetase
MVYHSIPTYSPGLVSTILSTDIAKSASPSTNRPIDSKTLKLTNTTMTSTTPGVCLPGYASHFGINNIPFGIASSPQHPTPQCVSRFEDTVLFLADIPSLHQEIDALPPNTLTQPTLNNLAALPRSVHQQLRQKIQTLLQTSSIPSSALEPLASIRMYLPVRSPDFTDFSCSADHVLNASEAMTGVRSTPPSFFHQPVGYAGRCSSLDVSGSAQERPLGQFWAGKPGESEIVFGASRRMDYELEVGVIVGKPSGRRERVQAREAGGHIFGFVLVNDWSGEFVE